MITTKTAPIEEPVTNATVEFWFRMTQNVNLTNYLFSLWGVNGKNETFSIFFDVSRILVCAPFGFVSVQSPYIAYTDYTAENIKTYGWFHLTCQFDNLKENKTTGYIHKGEFEKKYT